jgi:hypothetical protein
MAALLHYTSAESGSLCIGQDFLTINLQLCVSPQRRSLSSGYKWRIRMIKQSIAFNYLPRAGFIVLCVAEISALCTLQTIFQIVRINTCCLQIQIDKMHTRLRL